MAIVCARVWQMRIAFLLSCRSRLPGNTCMFVAAGQRAEPKDPTITALDLQSGNGSIMPLVASARTIIFVDMPYRTNWRCGGVRCRKQVGRPVKIRQRRHCSSPVLSKSMPLTAVAVLSFLPELVPKAICQWCASAVAHVMVRVQLAVPAVTNSSRPTQPGWHRLPIRPCSRRSAVAITKTPTDTGTRPFARTTARRR
jgi:hypothetical protein